MLSWRLADLWLRGPLGAFDDGSMAKLVTRVAAVRKRLQLYSVSPPPVQSLMWHTVAMDALQWRESSLASSDDSKVHPQCPLLCPTPTMHENG